MKTVGLLLLIVGVAICAAFGSRNGPEMYEASRLNGAAAFLETEESREAAAAFETPPPEARLRAWAATTGGPFAIGLLFVIAGSVMARVAVRRDGKASADPATVGAVDFRALLATVATELRALAQETNAKTRPEPPDFERVKTAIEALQLDRLEPLVEARVQVQNRYGLATFAAIFDPLSSGERLVNRAWAALVDDHWPEAADSLNTAAAYLEAALEAVPA